MDTNESHNGQVMAKIAHKLLHLLLNPNTISEYFLISKLNKINVITVKRSNKNSDGIEVIFFKKNIKYSKTN